jgi:hypothetical protein
MRATQITRGERHLEWRHVAVRVLACDALPHNDAKAKDVSLFGVELISEHFRRSPEDVSSVTRAQEQSTEWKDGQLYHEGVPQEVICEVIGLSVRNLDKPKSHTLHVQLLSISRLCDLRSC